MGPLPIFIWVIIINILLLSCMSVLYSIDINPLADNMVCRYLSHSIGFHSVSLAMQEIFSLIESYLFIFYFVAYVLHVISKISLPRPMSSYFKMFFLLCSLFPVMYLSL